MKKKQKDGFTLLEVLMVISIMVLLMGMMGAGVGAAIARSKRIKAKAETAELVRAWKGYWRTYGKWPSSLSVDAQGKVMDQEMDEATMRILSGTDASQNPKKIKFIDLASSGKGLLDPWGRPYIMYFNATGTEGSEHFQTSVFFPASKRYKYEEEY